VSIKVTPRSTAERMVAIASRSSDPPHIHRPIAQVPSPIRDAVTSLCPMRIVSMSLSSRWSRWLNAWAWELGRPDGAFPRVGALEE
jgi:hypothetical protein